MNDQSTYASSHRPGPERIFSDSQAAYYAENADELIADQPQKNLDMMVLIFGRSERPLDIVKRRFSDYGLRGSRFGAKTGKQSHWMTQFAQVERQPDVLGRNESPGSETISNRPKNSRGAENDDQSTEPEEVAREHALGAFLNLGQRLSSSGTGGERFSERGPALSPSDANALFASIEGEIIPRLMLAHEPVGDDAARAALEDAVEPELENTVRLTDQDHQRFVELLLGDSEQAIRDAVGEMIERGLTRETLFLELLSGAARTLGEMWDRDLCDFTDVTIGLCRLHSVLREESDLFRQENDPNAAVASARSVLLATGSGDQHIFGVVLVGEFFRRAGWQVWSEPGATVDHLCGLLSTRRFDMIGLSVACDSLVADVTEEIEAYRKASLNREIKVLVGGRLFAESPELATAVRADALSLDARQSPSLAEELIDGTFGGAGVGELGDAHSRFRVLPRGEN